jgi:hypothetical protein
MFVALIVEKIDGLGWLAILIGACGAVATLALWLRLVPLEKLP